MRDDREIEFFFDVGSPYSYLASTQLDELARRTETVVRWRPFLLGAVFQATGNDTPAAVEAKGRYMVRDLQRWAQHYGVELRFPSRFPLNTLRTQRTLVTAARRHGEQVMKRLATALFRAYWIDDRDVSDADELKRVAEEVQLEGDTILRGTDDPEIKSALRATTDEAVARGAFGAPTLFVGDEMFWGNDRLELLEAYLRGAGR